MFLTGLISLIDTIFIKKRDLFWGDLRFQEFYKFGGKVFNITGLAFPHNKNLPASFTEFQANFIVTLSVAVEFRFPKAFSRGRADPAIFAVMSVPKTAVNEDDFFVADKDDIGMAGKVTSMQGITITHTMNDGTNGYFWRGVLRLPGKCLHTKTYEPKIHS